MGLPRGREREASKTGVPGDVQRIDQRLHFAGLAEVYLRLCSQPRLDLFRWESEDADVFKGVRMSQPAAHTWLQEFFCAMGLLLLDHDEYTGEDMREPDNPLATIGIGRQSYPDLTDTIKAVTAEELARTGVADTELKDLEEKKAVFLALHQQMEEILERQEEDEVIDAPLDPDKVADFEERYVFTFTDQFVFRHLLDEATFLVDKAPWLQAALHRHGLRFQHETHGNRNAVERVFREVKRRITQFSNCFSHADANTVENWLKAFALVWN